MSSAVYEYFLGRFAAAEGRNPGEFYTPRSVRVLVEMLEPYQGRVFDPCCGSAELRVCTRDRPPPVLGSPGVRSAVNLSRHWEDIDANANGPPWRYSGDGRGHLYNSGLESR